MKAIWTIIASSIVVLLTQTANAQTSVGYYDENMVFHYGSAPSTSNYEPPADSSYYQGGYSGPSILETWMNDAYKEANKMALDFNRRSRARQADQKRKREARQAEQKRKREQWKLDAARRRAAFNAGLKSKGTPFPKTNKPLLKPVGMDRTGNDWFVKIFDLKPRAVSSQLRSGDNYARKGDWDKAIRSYEAAVRVDPKDQTARRKLASARRSKKNAKPKKKFTLFGKP